MNGKAGLATFGAAGQAGPGGLGGADGIEKAVRRRPKADIGVEHLHAIADEPRFVDIDEAQPVQDGGRCRPHLEPAAIQYVSVGLQGDALVGGEGQPSRIDDGHAGDAGFVEVVDDGMLDRDRILRPRHATILPGGR